MGGWRLERGESRKTEKGQPRGAQLRGDEHRGLALDSGGGGGGWGRGGDSADAGADGKV